MPKTMYTTSGEQITANDEQVELLVKDGYTFRPPKKHKEEKVEVAVKTSEESKDVSSDDEDTKKGSKKIKKKKL